MTHPTVSAAAIELVLAAPACMTDIYQVHQQVWRHVDAAKDLQAAPTFLYRRDQGLITVRVTQTPLRYGQPQTLQVSRGEKVLVRSQCCLWREVVSPGFTSDDAQTRVTALLEAAGLEVQQLQFEMHLYSGRKTRGQHLIQLPVAHLVAQAVIKDAAQLAQAWSTGIGRGRRFGFGLLDISELH